ncbi:hypothetical protein GCM10010123_19290 [Pilimelia anulata]|uniref:Uncharacterized protein n=1 Tax=Pilimelia anulata TaxID=53371 RepID=A0A8J3B2J7_9ACTN|nr:hypothetical protein [Pilimelia anulata]GGJ89674.1 hypothetical protein GCM10010123_19290 [Pilimelia anulata]
MIRLLRRRAAAYLQGTTFCDSCYASQVCTPECRAEGHYQRIRNLPLVHTSFMR